MVIWDNPVPLKSHGSAAVPRPVTVRPGKAVARAAAVALNASVAVDALPLTVRLSSKVPPVAPFQSCCAPVGVASSVLLPPERPNGTAMIVVTPVPLIRYGSAVVPRPGYRRLDTGVHGVQGRLQPAGGSLPAGRVACSWHEVGGHLDRERTRWCCSSTTAGCLRARPRACSCAGARQRRVIDGRDREAGAADDPGVAAAVPAPVTVAVTFVSLLSAVARRAAVAL